MTYDYGRPYGNQRVVAIEYHPYGPKNALTPHSVFTTNVGESGRYCHAWDFDWCRRDHTLYFHCSGSGGDPYIHPLAEPNTPPRCAVWWDAGIVRMSNGRIHKRFPSMRTIKRWGYDVLLEPIKILGGSQNPFDDACSDNTEYCTRCSDDFPTENLCRHIWWCEKCGVYSAPQDRCKHRRP